MAAEENKTIARDFLERVWNDKDFSAVDQLIASNHVSNGPFTDQLPQGREGVRAFAASFVEAFPDVHCTIESQEVDGDLVRTQVTYRGTQTGQLMDIPATNRQTVVPVLITDRFEGGKIVETWAEWDSDDMMRQLGVG
jgi:steroid delta-isomerase-like uncharacterized protein